VLEEAIAFRGLTRTANTNAAASGSGWSCIAIFGIASSFMKHTSTSAG
jgi:hypothetical protein